MKFYWVILLCTFFTSASYSQIHFGVKGGIGVNDIYWNQDLASDDTKKLTSIHGGVFVRIEFSDKLSLVPELQYITKGYSVDENASSGTTAYKVKFNYVELPVLLNYQFVKCLSVEAGPSLAIKTHAKTVSDSGDSDFINDYIEPVDFGVVGGLRLNFTKKLSLIARYNHGLSAVEKVTYNAGPYSMINTEPKAYNRNVQFSIAYKIR